MLQALLHLVATQPRWLAGHAEAYVDLVTAEFGSASSDWKRRAIFGALALCGLGVGTVLAGVALMLWAILPSAQILAPWALVAAPALPLAGALICGLIARRDGADPNFACMRQQIKADLVLLREVSNS
jgi:hypothetical protein